ncbi:uncharacterized protein PSFLO_03113 [Pseudozyma flocculosa]|uniref:Uncharacterized protein n=2 Tax=Pseudozyma flocculosa TaxID=84751 RepID=A0A5C3EZJ0_9BASI|nr:uncharacterized protein PSFLO_03113 [Pseudozyma flocculosa]
MMHFSSPRAIVSIATVAVAVLATVCSAASLPRLPVEAALDRRQGPNLVYPGNEAVQTGAFNLTAFIVPIPTADAAKLAGPFPLLPHGLPSSVVPAGMHPLMVHVGYFSDLRQDVVGLLPIRIDRLRAASFYIPFVDRIGTGRPFARSVVTLQDELVPVIVSRLTGLIDNRLASFDPPRAAYKEQGGRLTTSVFQGLSIAGIGIQRAAITASFRKTTRGPIREDVLRGIIGQPYFVSDLTEITDSCYKITYLYTFPDANPSFVEGALQLEVPTTRDRFNYDVAYGYTAAT